jgi:hypothetical protein
LRALEASWSAKQVGEAGDRPDVLATLVEVYEGQHWPNERPDSRARDGDDFPRSVMITGPLTVAFLARPTSWLKSRAERVVIVMYAASVAPTLPRRGPCRKEGCYVATRGGCRMEAWSLRIDIFLSISRGDSNFH